MNIEVNSRGVNKLIKATILPDEEMRRIGFTDYSKANWYFCKAIQFPKTKRYRGFDITFNVTIPKNGSDIDINVLDEHFCQPYDYQYMLTKNPNFEPCVIIKNR